MANPVDVRGREVEALARPVLDRPLADPAVRPALQGVFAEQSVADVDGSGRLIVVVVARVLRVVPADQPDVDARITVELREVPLVRAVVDMGLPELATLADHARQGCELRQVERAPAGNVLVDEALDVAHRSKSLAGLALSIAVDTACPKDSTVRNMGSGSPIGAVAAEEHPVDSERRHREVERAAPVRRGVEPDRAAGSRLAPRRRATTGAPSGTAHRRRGSRRRRRARASARHPASSQAAYAACICAA